MTCHRFGNAELQGWICGLPDYQAYICFESATYLFEFSRRFGPAWWRLEGSEEIEVEFEFDENYEVTSNKFLWDIFEEMKMGEKE